MDVRIAAEADSPGADSSGLYWISSSRCSVFASMPVGLSHPAGRTAGRRCQQNLAADAGQAVAEQADDRCFTGAGSAGQDQDRILQSLHQGIPLLGRQFQLLPVAAG